MKHTILIITKLINPGDSSKASNSKLVGYTGTIQQTTLSTKKNIANESSDSDGKGSGMDTPSDPVEDPLKWVDDGLPDLSGCSLIFDVILTFWLTVCPICRKRGQ